jgi:hypothetical protein
VAVILAAMDATMTIGDISRDRDRRAARLQRECKALFYGELSRQPVRENHQIHTELPDL